MAVRTITTPALPEKNPRVTNQTIQQLTQFVNAQQPYIDPIRDFNAVGDGNTDDTKALQAAGNAAISEGIPLYLTPTAAGYRVSDQGGFCLQFTAPIVILGQPGYSVLWPKSGTPTTSTILQLVGSGSGAQRNIIDGIMIANPSTGTYDGGNAVDFLTTKSGQLFLRPMITRNYFGTPNNGSGLSINVNNNAGLNGNGGFAYGLIQDNLCGAGISLSQAGDSIDVIHNVLTHIGSNTVVNKGFYANLITSAGNLVFSRNNGGIDASMCWIDYADTFDCSDNELEHVNVNNTDPIVNIRGAGARVQGGSIIDNELTVLGGSVHQPLCLNIDVADNTSVDLNTFQTYVAYVPFVITANAGSGQALGTKVGGLNKFPTSSTLRLTDNAAFTEYSRSKVLCGHTPSGSVGASNTTFYVANDLSTSEANVYLRCPYPNCIIKNLEIYFGNGAPGAGQSYTCTLMKNGSPTAVTGTITGGNSVGDITHQASYTVGDQFSIRVVSSATAAPASNVQWTLELCQF